MGFVTFLGKLSMPFLAVIGGFSTLKFAYDNGTLDRVSALAWAPDSLLPGTDIHLRQSFTGIEVVDGLMKSFNVFFYPALSGESPQLTLQGLHFLGQFASLWLLILVEAYRVGISWKPISFITFFGLLFENVAFALVLPIWLLLHLGLSPVIDDTLSPAIRRTSILVHPSELSVLPWSVLMGLGIPVSMILLTKPSTTSPWWASQQVWIALRMFHPIWTGMSHLVLSILSSIASEEPEFKSKSKRNRAVLAKLRDVYQLAINISIVTHVITLTLCLAPYFTPAVFADWVPASLNLVGLFKPVQFWGVEIPQVGSVTEGVLKLLQWDELISCSAALIWAVTVHRASIGGEAEVPSFLSTVGKAIAYSIIGGPAASTVVLIRERDQFMLLDGEVSEEKKNA